PVPARGEPTEGFRGHRAPAWPAGREWHRGFRGNLEKGPGLLAAEVAEGLGGGDAAARGADEVALLQEVGLVDLLEGVLFLADAGGEGLEADGSAVEAVDDHREQAAVHGVEAGFVHLQAGEGAGGAFAIDAVAAGLLHEVAHAAEETVGDARGTAGAAGDLD